MPTHWIAPTAVVLGNVSLGDDVSVWPTAVIRGDIEHITIGRGTNVQDGTVIHADPGVPTVIGEDCVIGHRAIVHGSTVEDGCLIGIGAILLNRCHIGAGSIVGAGALLTEGTVIPPGSLALGTPAKVTRQLTPQQQSTIIDNAKRYAALKERHRNGEFVELRSAPAR